MPTKRTYGWRPDTPDFRDYYLEAPVHALPDSVDLRPNCPPVLDQGQLGSCTANAIAEAIEFDRMKQKLAKWLPSRLFIYYNERVIEGTVSEDAGAEIRDGVKSINALGAPPESAWPYNISKFAKKPPKTVYTKALGHKSLVYKRLNQTLKDMQGCLALGYPFVGGFTVYESFESDTVATTGVVPMPSKSESVLGGHAILIVGYNNATSRFLVQNSWGVEWGIKGFFTIPFSYFTNPDLASDFWQITTVQ